MLNIFPPRFQWFLSWPVFLDVMRTSVSAFPFTKKAPQKTKRYLVYPACSSSKRETTFKSLQSWNISVVISYCHKCLWCGLHDQLGLKVKHNHFVTRLCLWGINEQCPFLWLVIDVNWLHKTTDIITVHKINIHKEEWDWILVTFMEMENLYINRFHFCNLEPNSSAFILRKFQISKPFRSLWVMKCGSKNRCWTIILVIWSWWLRFWGFIVLSIIWLNFTQFWCFWDWYIFIIRDRTQSWWNVWILHCPYLFESPVVIGGTMQK